MIKGKGLLQTIYRDWCDQNGVKLINPDETGGSQYGNFFDMFHAEENREFFTKPFDQKNPLIIKCDEISKEYRNQGNQDYQSRHNSEAIDNYTNALKYARPGSEAQALAYANRSATFADLGLFNDALRDIKRTIRTGSYPERLKYKLLERKAKCLLTLGHNSQSRLSYKSALVALQVSDLKEDKKNTVSENLHNIINNIIESDDSPDNPDCFSNPSIKSKLPKIPVKNQTFPNLSDAINIKFDKDVGRHGVANRDIEMGEILCVQIPAVSRLCFFRRGRNCSNCFETGVDWVPSPLTNNDVFCSEDCLDEALNSFHKIDAKLDFVLNEENGFQYELLLALRLITLKPSSFYHDLNKSGKFQCALPTYGTKCNTDFTYDDQDFESHQNLVTLDEKFTAGEHHFVAFVGSFFVNALLHAGFFEEKKYAFKDQEKFIGKIIMQMILAGTLNTHDVHQYEAPLDKSWFHGTTRTIGHAMNPTLALINHSCDPNSVHYNVGKATVSVAIKKILKGEEIVECYHGFYGSTSIEDRQKFLMDRFKFACQCRACENNWPIVDDRLGFNTFAKKSNGICPDISSQRETMIAVQTILNAIDQQISVENFDRVFELYMTLEKHIQANLPKPHPLFAKTSRDLYKCLWIRSGSKKRLPLCRMPII